MPGFRLRRLGLVPAGSSSVSLNDVRRVIAQVVRPGHFFAPPPTELAWEQVTEEIPWELFHGRLLDRSQTREARTFEAWNSYLIESGQRSGEPLLSVKLDAATGKVYVVRAIHCYAWEGYDAGNNVFLSRETQKWVRELVAEIDARRLADAEVLADELVCALFHAVVGASRLPLTSVESPLPLFSLGRLAYFHRPDLPHRQEPRPPDLQPYFNDLEQAKLLETVLRAPADVEEFVQGWNQLGRQPADLLAVLRRVFDEVALSPHTGFLDAALQFLRLLEAKQHIAAADVVDFLSYLLRHLARHLTAYDLHTFHHQGANYPDALLLDAALKEYLTRIEQHPELFTTVLRRRALRQAWMPRRFYEGLAVPDAPTSPGENARILPPPHVRVPEEQILDPEKRTKRLFAGDPLHPGERAQEVLRQSLHDLSHPSERRELGMALFVDRPLGIAKPPQEPDRTPLVSYEAFSRIIAGRRLRYLADDLGLLSAVERDDLLAQLRTLPVPGVPLPLAHGVTRPGAVSLDDARKAAADFVFLRTTARSRWELGELFDFIEVEKALGPWTLLMRDENPERLALYAKGRKLAELRVRVEQGYASRAGVEFPVDGLEAYVDAKALPVPVRER